VIRKGFALKLAREDADLAIAAARGAGIDLRVTNSFIETWRRTVANGRGDDVLSVVYTNDESRAKHTSGSKARGSPGLIVCAAARGRYVSQAM